MAYYIGIDIGGTSVKAGITDEHGHLVCETNIPTAQDGESVVRGTMEALDKVMTDASLTHSDIRAVGVGCPGTVRDGVVLYNNNLGWRNFPLTRELEAAFGLPVRAENDANAAALGEVIAGSAKGASSAMIITLGTGVGFGLVIDGAIWTGHNGAACEFGHMVVERGGRQCTCGRRGCLEAYASATGLLAMTREAMKAHGDSSMHKIAERDGKVGGHTAFEAADGGDAAAAEVVDRYLDYLACGVANIINGLQPEVISIGGGVAKQGERLLEPLRKRAEKDAYGFSVGAGIPKIVCCTLGYKAGLIGAAMAAKNVYPA